MIVLAAIIRTLLIAAIDVALWAVANPLADIPLGLLAFVLLLFFKPYRACRWCRPGGLIGGSLPARLAGYEPKTRKKAKCWRCKRSKLTRRLGAYHVHKAKLSLIQAWQEREFWR